MDEAKRAEIKGHIDDAYEVGCDLVALGRSIETKYIFGPIANNEHYKISEIMAIVHEVNDEHNPEA